MSILKTIKNIVSRRLDGKQNEDGVSVIEMVMGVAIVSSMAVVGMNTMGSDGISGIMDNAKQAQSASLLQDTMTNIVFYDIDGDPETTTEYAINEFNKVNSQKGFTAHYKENSDCLAVQIVANNGINSIQADGTNCDGLVKSLNESADKNKDELDNNDETIIDSNEVDDTINSEYEPTFTDFLYEEVLLSIIDID